MPKVTQPQPNNQLEHIKQGAAAQQAMLQMAKTVIITDAASFAKADLALSRLTDQFNHFDASFSEILDPLNAARLATNKVKKEVMDPWQLAIEFVTGRMKAYKMEEARLAREEEIRVQIESRKLLEEAERKERQAENAKSEAVRKRLEKAKEVLEEQAREVVAVPIAAPVRVENSTTRKVKAWKLTGMPDLVEAVMACRVPMEALRVDDVWMNRKLKESPDEVAVYPGIEVYEDIQIVRR